MRDKDSEYSPPPLESPKDSIYLHRLLVYERSFKKGALLWKIEETRDDPNVWFVAEHAWLSSLLGWSPSARATSRNASVPPPYGHRRMDTERNSLRWCLSVNVRCVDEVFTSWGHNSCRCFKRPVRIIPLAEVLLQTSLGYTCEGWRSSSGKIHQFGKTL